MEKSKVLTQWIRNSMMYHNKKKDTVQTNSVNQLISSLFTFAPLEVMFTREQPI